MATTSAPVHRATLGASRAVGPRWRVGLSVGHKSNGASDRNPSVETLLLSLHRSL